MTLEEAIKALGTTPESVTVKLREVGVKGYRRICHSCPIAKYLNACGFSEVTIGTTANTFRNGSDASDESYILPDGVKVWVQNFDDGMYPEFYLE